MVVVVVVVVVMLWAVAVLFAAVAGCVSDVDVSLLVLPLISKNWFSGIILIRYQRTELLCRQ